MFTSKNHQVSSQSLLQTNHPSISSSDVVVVAEVGGSGSFLVAAKLKIWEGVEIEAGAKTEDEADKKSGASTSPLSKFQTSFQ